MERLPEADPQRDSRSHLADHRSASTSAPEVVPPAVRAQRQAAEAEVRRLAARFVAGDDGAVSSHW